MRRSLLAFLLGSAALPAAAQISPEDVWSIYGDYLRAFGLEVSAAETREGDSLVLSEVVMNARLPAGIGSVSATYGPVTLTELGDGRVRIIYPESGRFGIEAAFMPDIRLSAEVEMTLVGADVTASGTPGDLVIRSDIEAARGSLARLELDGMPELESYDDGSVRFGYSTAAQRSATRLRRDGDLIVLEAQTETGPADYSFDVENAEAGVLQTNSGTSGSARTSIAIALPQGGIDYMNLAGALRQGLSLEATSRTNDATNTAQSRGEVVSEQRSMTALVTGSLRVGPEGVAAAGRSEDVSVTYSMPDLLALPVEVRLAAGEGTLAFPLLAGGPAAPARYAMTLDGLDMSGQIYRLLDPAGLLPRDPISMEIDVEAQVRLLADAVDFLTLGAMIEGGQSPAEVDSVTLNAGDLSALGAELASSGSFTLDFDDMQSFDGIPRPAGSASARVTGLNALLDGLIEIGMLGAKDVAGARMGMAVAMRSVGDDVLESSLVVTEDGEVFVNGVRMR